MANNDSTPNKADQDGVSYPPPPAPDGDEMDKGPKENSSYTDAFANVMSRPDQGGTSPFKSVGENNPRMPARG